MSPAIALRKFFLVVIRFRHEVRKSCILSSITIDVVVIDSPSRGIRFDETEKRKNLFSCRIRGGQEKEELMP